MSRFRDNVSANILANIWSTVLSLVLTPVYISLLGVESYGLIGFHLSWIAILGILDTGISTAAVRETAWLSARPDGRDGIPSLLRSLEVLYWAIVLALGAVLIVATWWLGGRWFPSATLSPDFIRTALLLMVVSLVAQVPSGLYVGGLMGLQRQVECSALLAVFGTLRGVGALIVLWAIQPDIRLFFAWQIVASALQTFALRRSLTRHVAGAPARFSPQLLRTVTQFAGETSFVTALSLVLVQADKMILSRLVSLEAFGFYMLAWTVSSGLFRVATPLLQAFSPRFTVLVSQGDLAGLSRQVRLASQLTGVLLLPPAALLMLLPRSILDAWTGNPDVAGAAAPLLAMMTVGTALAACSYPALSVLYSSNRLRPVIAVYVGAVIVLLPIMTIAALRFGVVGAAMCWPLYGLFMYAWNQILGLKDLPDGRLVWRAVQDFAATAAASLAVAAIAALASSQVDGRIEMAALLALALIVGWISALLVSRDLLRIALHTLRWKPIATPWSA